MTRSTDLRRFVSPGRARSPGGLLLGLILVAQFMAILDVNIVNVALPTMRVDLRASDAGLQMVVAGYIISYAVLLITGARLGDHLGHRRMLLAGLAIFTAASLGCGLAPSTGPLIAARFVQGAGAALMTPQVISMIQRHYTGAARARALGVYAAVIAGGVVAGQVAGGILVSADLLGGGWRGVFLVNVPLGALLLAAAPRVLPSDAGHLRRDGLDPLGLLTLGAAVLLFVVPLILGHDAGWPLWGWVSLAASVPAFAAFLAAERRLAGRGGRPLVSVGVLGVPGLPAAAAAVLLGPFTWGSFLFTTTLHLQGDLAMSPLRSGLAFVPSVAAFALVGLTWQRLPAGWHRRVIPGGFALAAAGHLVIGPLAGGGAGYELITAVIGLGLGAMPIVMTVALEHVPIEDASDASGLLLTLMQIGQVLGVATVGTLFLTMAQGSTTRHAEYGAGWAMAAAALLAAGCGLALARSRARAS